MPCGSSAPFGRLASLDPHGSVSSALVLTDFSIALSDIVNVVYVLPSAAGAFGVVRGGRCTPSVVCDLLTISQAPLQ